MIATRSQLLAEARSWIDTPWIHQQHLKGAGCDCIGIVAESARALGFIPDFVYPPYGRTPHAGQIQKYLDEHMTLLGGPEALSQALIGDVILAAWKVDPMHLAILGDYLQHGGTGEPFSLIHALKEADKVCETNLDVRWRSRIVAIYRIPGLG